MPWESQMRQALARGPRGTGGSLAQNAPAGDVGMTVGMIQPTRQENPYDLGAQFNAYYGGRPTHAVVSSMQNGQEMPGPGGAPAGNVAAQTRSVASSPAQASQMNAEMPGTFNGNPANGQKSEEEGFLQALRAPAPPRMPSQPPTTPSAPPQGGVMPMPTVKKPTQPAPSAAPAGEIAAAERGAAEAPQPLAATLSTGTASKTFGGGQIIDYPSTLKVPSHLQGRDLFTWLVKHGGTVRASDTGTAPPKGQAEQQPTGTPDPTPTETVVDPTATATTTGKPVTSPQGIDFNLVKPLPNNWAQMTEGEKSRWLADDANALPVNAEQAQNVWALNPFENLTNIKLPTTNPVTGQVVVDKSKMTSGALYQSLGNDPGLMKLADRGFLLHQSLYTNEPGSMTFYSEAERREANEEYRTIQNVLAGYGVYFPDNAPNAGGPPSGDGGTDTGGPDYGVDLAGDANQSLSAAYLNAVERFQKGGWGDKSQAMAEAYMASLMQERQDANRQQAVDLFGNAVEGFEQSPLYTGIQGLGEDILNNPTPIPWDTVKNQYVAGQSKKLNTDLDALSSAMNRRGLGPTSAAGVTGDILREAAGDQAMGLGQLDIQQAQVDRAMQDQALRAALAAQAGTSGVQMANIGNLANFVTGDPAQYQNPYSGISSAFMNIDAVGAQIDAAEKAGKFSWADAAQLFGSLAESGAKAYTPKAA